MFRCGMPPHPDPADLPDALADEGQPPDLRLLRLLVAFDALLAAGSVGGAARRLGLSAAATSRLLGQIRALLGDPIFIRAGRRMVPSPRAEALRPRLRALVREAGLLLDPAGSDVAAAAAPQGPFPAVRPAAAMRADAPSTLCADISPSEADPPAPEHPPAEARQRLARHLAAIGRSGGHGRPLSAAEAEDALSLILNEEADPLQVGALLSVLHHRTLTAPELAGFARAAQACVRGDAPGLGADLDWPAYMPSQTRRPLWFLQAALLVARAGHRVLVHGHGGTREAPAQLESAARRLGIPVCADAAAAQAALGGAGIAVVSLAGLSPRLKRLLDVNRLIEARGPVNALLHLINPLGARAVLAGPARAGYPELHRDAAALIGQRCLVLGGGRDVAEAAPARSAFAYGYLDGGARRLLLPPLGTARPQPLAGLSTLEFWTSVWEGTTRDACARDIVVATAALALLALSGGPEEALTTCRAEAEALWEARHARR